MNDPLNHPNEHEMLLVLFRVFWWIVIHHKDTEETDNANRSSSPDASQEKTVNEPAKLAERVIAPGDGAAEPGDPAKTNPAPKGRQMQGNWL